MSDKPLNSSVVATTTPQTGPAAKPIRESGPGAGPAAPAPQQQKQESESVKQGFLDKMNERLKEKFCTEQEVVGIEIQPDTIRFCQAREEKTGWKIIKIGSASVLNNYQHENIRKNKKLYSKTLKELFEKHKVSNKSIALAIPASITIIKTISLPLMTRENLERATKIPSFWQNLVQISENIAEYSIYYRIVKESPATKEMDVLFIAAKHEDIKAYNEIAKEAGLEICVIDVGCFSINNVAKLKKEAVSELQVYLKVSRDENYLQILEQGKPYIYDIFVSDNEKSYLNEFIENPTFQQRFVSQLKHIISKHEDAKKVKIEKIDVISSEANIDSFIAAINPKLDNVAIAPINLLENIQMPQEIANSQEFLNTRSSYAVAIGLATRHLDIFADENKMNVSETVNLLPNGADKIKGLKAKFYSKIAVWGTVISCIALVLLYAVFSVSRHASVAAETARYNEQNRLYQDQLNIFNQLTAQSGVLNRVVRIKESIPANQDVIIAALTEISSSIPEGVWIEEMAINNVGRVTITGRSFEERGIISFSKSFENSTSLEDIAIASLRSTVLENGSLVKEFIITGRLKGVNYGTTPAKQSGVK